MVEVGKCDPLLDSGVSLPENAALDRQAQIDNQPQEMRHVGISRRIRELVDVWQCILTLWCFQLRGKLCDLCSSFLIANLQQLLGQLGVGLESTNRKVIMTLDLVLEAVSARTILLRNS